MHPNLYLRTFWRATLRPEIFVAMSFAGAYQDRFERVIRPAIEAVQHHGKQLKANRVDLSRTGDSILSDISDGIAHSQLVLADVSPLGYDSKTGHPYRNGNVLYEVGLALACRHPSEVLLLRDDHDRFLFDVSTIPHKQINFADIDGAKTELAEALLARLGEVSHLNDARLLVAASTLTSLERRILDVFKDYTPDKTFWLTKRSLATIAAIPRLLDKQLLITTGLSDGGREMLRWTQLGYALAQHLDLLVPKREIEKPDATDSDAERSEEVNGAV